MEMEGKFYRPNLEAEPVRSAEARLVETVLTSVVPDATYDGFFLSWKQGGIRMKEPFTLKLPQGHAAVLGERAVDRSTKQALVLLPLRAELARRGAPFTRIQTKVADALNRLPHDVRNAANTIAQHASAEASRPRDLPEAPPHPPSAREHAMNVDYVHTLYRAKWLASGGPTDPSTFAGLPEPTKQWAKKEVEAIRLSFTDDPNGEHVIRGAALETFLSVEIEQQRWFDAEVVRVSTFDDYRNGLDLVLEWQEDEELGIIPRLAVDFTTAQSPETLSSKLAKLNKGTNVNFLRSKAEDFEGRVEDIPMVILGLNAEVLSEVGADLLRGGKMTPDHPLRALLLRQAEIQVGLQIRKLSADLVANALEERPNDPDTRKAVRAYADAMRADPSFTKDVARVADIVRSIPPYDLEYFLGSPRDATRLLHLLGIHRQLEKQLASADTQHPETKRLASSIRLSQRLEDAHAQPVSFTKTSPVGEVLRLGLGRRLCVEQLVGRIPFKQALQTGFGVASFLSESIDRARDLVGRPFRSALRAGKFLVFRHRLC